MRTRLALVIRAAFLAFLVARSAAVKADGGGAGMGFWSRDLSPAERAAVPDAEPAGALVVSVYPGSPAAGAGLLPFDHIVAVDGRPVRSYSGLRLGGKKPGDTVYLTLRRGADTSIVAVVLAERLSYLGVSCEAGDGFACADLSELGGSGDGRADPARRLALLRRGCELGSPRACTTLANRIAGGKDGVADHETGVAMLERECDGGHAVACEVLAWAYEGGRWGRPKSRSRRAAYHTKGCSAGGRTSCYELGKALEDGDGIRQDFAGAATAYGEACDRELEQACIEVARLSRAGRGVPPDREGAYRLYRETCDRGENAACISLGKALLADGEGRRGAAVLLAACDRGALDGCCLLGQAYTGTIDRADLPLDVPYGARLHRRACDAGHGHSCFYLGFMYDAGPAYPMGQGFARDVDRAMAFYLKGCALDYLPACDVAGTEYALGEMVPRDLARARTLLQGACDRGERGACRSIERLGLR